MRFGAGCAGVVLVASVAACSSSSSGTSTSTTSGATGSTTGGSTGSGTTTSGTSGAPDHPLFGQVPNNFGPTLGAPSVVALTYDDDPNQALEHAWLSWAVGSNWLGYTGNDYGVGLGGFFGDPGLGAHSPSNLSDSDVQTAIEAIFADAGMNIPTGSSSLLFMVFVPGTVTYDFFGTPACSAGSVDSYHLWFWHQNTQVPYAVVIDCPPELNRTDAQQLELDASHELIEAATDPFGFGNGLNGQPSDAWRITDAGDPFYAVGDEVADLCSPISAFYTDPDAGFFAQRVWSNAAAAAGVASPCIPAPAAEVFYTVASDAGVSFLRPGQSINVTLTGWASDAGQDAGPTWCVTTRTPDGSDFTPTLTFGDGGVAQFQPGTAMVATLGTPVGTKAKAPNDAGVIPLSYGPVLFTSKDCDAGTTMSVWPVQIALPPVGTACVGATPDPCAAVGLTCVADAGAPGTCE